MSKQPTRVTVNGKAHARIVEARLTLADFLRYELGLTGTHLGCEHGVCGACTVLVDGHSTRACLMFAVQANGCEVTTVAVRRERLIDPEGRDAEIWTGSALPDALGEADSLVSALLPDFSLPLAALFQ